MTATAVKVHSDDINLGGDASVFVALSDPTDSGLSAIVSGVEAAFDALMGAPSGPIGAPAKAAFQGLTASIASVAATSVKAK